VQLKRGLVGGPTNGKAPKVAPQYYKGRKPNVALLTYTNFTMVI